MSASIVVAVCSASGVVVGAVCSMIVARFQVIAARFGALGAWLKLKSDLQAQDKAGDPQMREIHAWIRSNFSMKNRSAHSIVKPVLIVTGLGLAADTLASLPDNPIPDAVDLVDVDAVDAAADSTFCAHLWTVIVD